MRHASLFLVTLFVLSACQEVTTVRVEGTFTAAYDGSPIARGQVSVRTGVGTQAGFATTNLNGFYSLSFDWGPCRISDFDVAVFAEGYTAEYSPRSYLISCTEELQTRNYRFDGPTISVYGQVTANEDGSPILGAMVEMMINDTLVAEANTNAEGHYSFSFVSEAYCSLISVSLEVSAPGFRPVTAGIECTGAWQPNDFQLER